MSKHIIHKHDSYCVIQANGIGIKYFIVFTNGDVERGYYEIIDGKIPEIEGYEETELQVLFDNFNINKGR